MFMTANMTRLQYQQTYGTLMGFCTIMDNSLLRRFGETSWLHI